MAEKKYEKYIIEEPFEKMGYTGIHICAEEGCPGSVFPNFPAEWTSVLITEPLTMNPKPHAHDYDQFLCFFGQDTKNFYEFDAEIEMALGEEGERNIIDKSSIVYIPKGMMHCPVTFKRVGKPVFFIHLCFAPEYSRSIGDMDGHPSHRSRIKFTPEEIVKLRKGITKDILGPLPPPVSKE